MAKFGERLKELRKSIGISQQKLADDVGTSKSSINMYERCEREPGLEMQEALSDYFNVDLDYLHGRSPVKNRMLFYDGSSTPGSSTLHTDVKIVPLVGTIACGMPILAAENIECWMVSPSKSADFCLRCKGDSMIGARINDGDIVFLRQQPDVDDGQIAAVLIGDEATLKRCYHTKDGLIMQAENPKYPTRVVSGEDVRILGLAVGFYSDIK